MNIMLKTFINNKYIKIICQNKIRVDRDGRGDYLDFFSFLKKY